MSLNSAAFETYFNDGTTGIYRDGQGASSITPGDHRDFVEKVADNFTNKYDSHHRSVGSSGTTVAFSFENINTRLAHVCDTIFAGAKTFTFSNATGLVEAILFFETNTSVDITLPATGVLLNDVRWNNSTNILSLIDAGKYKAHLFHDGTQYYLDVAQAPYV